MSYLIIAPNHLMLANFTSSASVEVIICCHKNISYVSYHQHVIIKTDEKTFSYARIIEASSVVSIENGSMLWQAPIWRCEAEELLSSFKRGHSELSSLKTECH